MADPTPSSLYMQQYTEAVRLFDDGQIDGCIAETKKNLTDPTLPPFYIIKNCILLACALDDWNEADGWRLSAEQSYRTTLDEATRKQDLNSLLALSDLRKELDELYEFRMEDLTGMTREERDMCGMEDDMHLDEEDTAMQEYDDEDLAGIDLEDAEAVAKVENEMEVAAEHIRVPIRSTNEVAPTGTKTARKLAIDEELHQPSSMQADNPGKGKHPANEPPVPKLRRQKSTNLNKGGAFHAHQFAKSLGRSGTKSRPSTLNIDWTPKDKEERS
ncbi:hypothetical protein ACN47E_004576 [Coniothyrium glycines]